jgi:hypothetical protein
MGHVSPCVALNHISYNWAHRFLYTYDELVAALATFRRKNNG